MIVSSLLECLAELSYRIGVKPFYGIEGYNLSVNGCSGSQMVLVIAFSGIGGETLADKCRRESSPCRITLKFYHNVGLVGHMGG